MAIEYNFTLDMDRSKRDNNIAYARTGDVDSITINADLVLNGAAYTPTGTNAFFECVTPNGHSVRTAAQKTGSSVSVEVPSAAFQAAGVINVAYFRFESGDSSNPTYVESTEPFAIVVREGIGDNIDAGDYIEEWRGLADKLEAAVAEVEKKAEQAETAINEQKTEVDQLKAQAQKAIAGDVTEVEDAAQSAIAAINKEKADVADAAEDVSAAGEQAINAFKTNSQQAISQFKTNGTSAISQFNKNADAKLDEVDGMITDAQGDVNAAITQLETATSQAVSAMEDALDGTTAGSLQNAINRTLKLDVADMTNIANSTKLSSLTNVGSYCCKTAASAATISDSPVDDSPFNMYVFSSATSGQVMQLVVPIDLNGKPTAEWHVRFGTSSAMDKWSVIGGGADIAAGLGINVTGDAKKTVSLDTDAFYQHHEAADIIRGSTEVTGGGRIKELTVYGATRQNLWVNPSGTSNGLTVTANVNGSVTLSGTALATNSVSTDEIYILRPGSTYTLSIDKAVTGGRGVWVNLLDSNAQRLSIYWAGGSENRNLSVTFTVPSDAVYATFGVGYAKGQTLSGTYRVMLNEGATAQPWCPPGLNSVDKLSVVCAGKNLFTPNSNTQIQGNGGSNQVIAIGTKVSGIPTQRDVVFSFEYKLSSGAGTVSVQQNGQPYASLGISQLALTGDGQWHKVSGKRTVVDAFNKSDNVAIRLDNVTGLFEFRNIQLELGSTATAYEPPAVTTTPIDLLSYELRSLPDGTRDELTVDSTGTVTLTQRVGSYVADGDEGWKLSASGDAPYRMCVDSWKADVVNNPLGYNEFRSTMLPTSGIGSYYNGSYVVINGRYQLYAGRTGITTADAFSEWLKTSPMTVLYPLATPKKMKLPDVSLPSLDSVSYTVFASSSMPAEIEAEVVKVDYLPPSDAYTKEEVDKKIEDASMPDVVPVSKGGTGVTTAAAERNRLGLGNTTGALPVANGGTGATAAKAAQYNLLNGIGEVDVNINDGSLFTFTYVTPSSTNGVLYKSAGSNVWNWIVGKIRSTFGFNSSNVLTVAKGGTGSTSAKAAQNSLLNDMTESSTALTDSSMLVGYNISPTASNGAVHKRQASTVWDYVAGKIRSTFGFSSSNVLPVSHGGTGLTANPSMLVNLGSVSASNVLASSPRPGVTGTLPVSHGGTGATAPGVDMLRNLGITFGTADPPSTGTPGSIYIQYFK